MAGDCFIKFEQVTGETDDQDFRGAIDVAGWTWGVNWSANRAAVKTSGQGAAADVRSFEFTHRVDSATAGLLQRCVGGAKIREAVLSMRRAGGKAQKYLQITFKGVQIVSVSLTHDAVDLIPIERVVFAFESVTLEYVTQAQHGGDRTGRHTFQWTMSPG